MKGKRTRRNVTAALLMAAAAAVPGVAGASQAAQASDPVPYPAALANHLWVPKTCVTWMDAPLTRTAGARPRAVCQGVG